MFTGDEKERMARSNEALLPTCSDLQIPITVEERKGFYYTTNVRFLLSHKRIIEKVI